MGFQTVESRPRGLKLQEALSNPGLQVDPDRAHVADDLVRRFLKGEVEATFAAPAGRMHVAACERRLPGAGGTRDEHARSAIKSPTFEHAVQPWNAAGNPRGRGVVIQPEAGHG